MATATATVVVSSRRACNYSWLFRQVLVLIFSLFAYISLPFSILLIPVYFFRFFVSGLAQLCRKDFGKMLTPRSTLFATEHKEMFSSRTRCTVYVWFVIDIMDVELDKIYKFFHENVVLRQGQGGELQNPELQQTIVPWLGYLFWKWDRNFAMENHVHVYKGPGKVEGITEEDMPGIVKDLATKPFPVGRSPWDVWVWNDAKLEEDAAGATGDEDDGGKKKRLFLLRMHHSLGDGFSIMKLLVEDIHGTVMPGQNFESHNYKPELSVWQLSRTMVRAPYDMIRTAVHSWDFNEWRLPEKKLTGWLHSALTNRVPVQRVKEIKRAHGTSFTAVIMAAFAGGIRNFMEAKGMKIPEKIHCVVPLPMPGHPNKLRNYITAVIAPLPVGLEGSKERLERADQMLMEAKKSTVPIATFICLPLLGALPLFVVKLLARNLITTALMSIVPGPAFTGKLMGHEAHRIMFGGGLLVGNIGLGLSCLSYNGYMRFGVGLDSGIYEDPVHAQELVRLIQTELDVMFQNIYV